MKYIAEKMPKIWREKLDNQVLTQVVKAFANVVPVGNIEGLDFLKIYSQVGNFPHPETDKTDGSVGVQPKQIKKFLKSQNIEDLEKVLWILHIGLNPSVDSDGFVDWDSVWAQHVGNNLESPNIIKSVIHSVTGISTNDQLTLDKLTGNPYLLTYALELKKQNNLSSQSLTDIEDEMKAQWKAMKMNPKSKALIISNSEHFNREVLDYVTKMNGSETLMELSFAKQYYAVTIAERFGELVLSMPLDRLNIHGYKGVIGAPQILQSKEDSIFELFNEMNLQQLDRYGQSLSMINPKKLKELILGEDHKVSADILNTLINVKLNFVESNNLNLVEFVDSLPSRHLKYLYRYNKNLSVTVVTELFNIFEQRSQVQNIPSFKGSVGSYSYEMIDKTESKEGLILGYATDCCQVAFGVGEACLKVGYSNPNAGFFVVRKSKKDSDSGKIYGQSYTISGVDKNNLKYIVFDSIEVLGGDLKQMSGVMNSYNEAAQKLINEGYDYVLCGADGSHLPDGLEDAALGFLSSSTCYNNGISVEKALGQHTYTDMKNGCFVLAGSLPLEFDEFHGFEDEDNDDYDDDEDDWEDDEDYDEDNE